MTVRLSWIIAFSLFAFCLGEPDCGSDTCRDLWTAKRCNKVKYCIAEEWPKLRPTGNRDNVCDTCLRMVQEARTQLQSNETKEEMLEVFEGSCRLLVLKPAVELCDKIVDQLVPEVIEILSSEMDPETVCTVAKLCNNGAFRTAQKNSKECVYCETLTAAAAEQMASLSSEEFKNQIFDLCRTAGSFSDACSHIGSEYSSSLYNSAKSVLANKPCEATSMCPSGLSSSQFMHNIKKKMCPLCRNVMTNLRKQLLNVKSSEEFVANTFDKCTKLRFSNSTCSEISSPSLYEKLKSSDTLPHLFCQITFCRQRSKEGVPVWPLVPAHSESFGYVQDLNALELLDNLEMFFPVVKQEESEPLGPVISYGDPIQNPVYFAPNSYAGDFEDCKTCTDVLEILSKPANVDKEHSEKIFTTVCDKVQNTEKCKRFVEKFSPVLIKTFAEDVVSKEMCKDLVPSCQIKRNDLQTEKTSINDTCALCLNALRVFKQGDPALWRQVIEEKCKTLPENSRVLCMKLSASHLKNFTENETCNILKLCGPSAVQLRNISVPSTAVNEKNSYCQDCMLVFQSMSDFLKNNNSNIIIRVVLESVCYMLPPAADEMCRRFIDIIGVDGIKKLIENLNPSEICSELHICSKREESDVTVLANPSTGITSATKKDKVPCKFCMMAIKMLLDELQDDKTEDSIRKALNSLCKYFPEETRDTCKNLVDEYTEDLIDMIIADFNATEICVYLKLCPANRLLKDANKSDFAVFDIHTNEIRDWDDDSRELAFEFSRNIRVGTVISQAPSEEDFQKFHKIVQECALCEALVGVVSSHKKMLEKDYDFAGNANIICSIVPANRKKMCMSMIVSYGPSIKNLIVDQKVDLNEVCVRVDLCDSKMQAKVNQPVSVSEEKFVQKKDNDCLLGPVFWCANADNAEKCGTYLHCQEMVWKHWKHPPRSSRKH